MEHIFVCKKCGQRVIVMVKHATVTHRCPNSKRLVEMKEQKT